MLSCIGHLDFVVHEIFIASLPAGVVIDAYSDFVIGHGEIWCARLFAASVRQKGLECRFMDTREVLVVNSPDGEIIDVEYAESNSRLDKWALSHGVPKVQLCKCH